MEGVTGMMAWLGHVPGSCLGGVYGHADIDKPFFSYRVCTALAEMEAADSASRRAATRQRADALVSREKISWHDA